MKKKIIFRGKVIPMHYLELGFSVDKTSLFRIERISEDIFELEELWSGHISSISVIVAQCHLFNVCEVCVDEAEPLSVAELEEQGLRCIRARVNEKEGVPK